MTSRISGIENTVTRKDIFSLQLQRLPASCPHIVSSSPYWLSPLIFRACVWPTGVVVELAMRYYLPYTAIAAVINPSLSFLPARLSTTARQQVPFRATAEHRVNTQTHRVVFVRHGQSTWNRDSKYIGWTGNVLGKPLTSSALSEYTWIIRILVLSLKMIYVISDSFKI